MVEALSDGNLMIRLLELDGHAHVEVVHDLGRAPPFPQDRPGGPPRG